MSTTVLCLLVSGYSCDGVRYRQTRRRRDRQTNGTYAVNVRLQQSPAASATPSTAATAAANDNWAFLYDVNALPGYASLPYNRCENTTTMIFREDNHAIQTFFCSRYSLPYT